MDEYNCLSHAKWGCKYHVMSIPKCLRKMLYGELRKHLGEVFRKLALAKEGKSYGSGPSHAGSRSHDDLDPPEVCGLAGGWVHQGQDCLKIHKNHDLVAIGILGQAGLFAFVALQWMKGNVYAMALPSGVVDLAFAIAVASAQS